MLNLDPTRTIPFGAGPGQSLDDRWTRRQHLAHTGGTERQTNTPKLSKNLASVKRSKYADRRDQIAADLAAQLAHAIERGRLAARRRDRRELNGLNIYEPHQGRKEMDRRLQRLARGIAV